MLYIELTNSYRLLAALLILSYSYVLSVAVKKFDWGESKES